ncbi:hypothetical protein BGZ58_002719 [Dissophora ornata]|nr:hypothetical protein BGZ58_002719 [Dissophora ornata]
MSASNVQEQSMPTVLIAGGGIGGLMLGTLFERINIPYHIFERASELRSLGSVMTLGANILPVFEQLGLLDEIYKISKPCPSLDFYGPKAEKIGSIKLMGEKGSGYENLLFARPKLYELLRSQVPTQKISLNKRILRTEEKDGRVHIYCSDGTMYEGDILVGADGAHSGVRQSLYKHMDEQGILPQSDLESMSIGFLSMVGVANPPNPEKYPQLKDNFSHFSSVFGGSSDSWSAISVSDNQICWSLGVQLSESEAKELQFRNSEWSPESNDAMIKEYQDCPCPWGGTMGEIIEATPKDLISKVFLEEKFFKTWYHGRTVLIGDGAVNAMHDAVVLANCIYTADNITPEGITRAFEDFYNQRYQYSYDQFKNSSKMTQTFFGQSWLTKVIRSVLLSYLPNWVHQMSFAKTLSYRPQIAWLPLAENRGTVRVQPQTGKRKVIEQQA